ncbi:hypothetical protein [Lacrimispora xylanisolvens]|uniref:hypothetical protein n=1 Tax=Lacrimispora xylanisolvens TaxID=384636 RepID=UPI003D9CBE93
MAPVKFSFAGKGKEQSSRQGNRQLHGLFYFLAVTMVSRPKNGWHCLLRKIIYRSMCGIIKKIQKGKEEGAGGRKERHRILVD